MERRGQRAQRVLLEQLVERLVLGEQPVDRRLLRPGEHVAHMLMPLDLGANLPEYFRPEQRRDLLKLVDHHAHRPPLGPGHRLDRGQRAGEVPGQLRYGPIAERERRQHHHMTVRRPLDDRLELQPVEILDRHVPPRPPNRRRRAGDQPRHHVAGRARRPQVHVEHRLLLRHQVALHLLEQRRLANPAVPAQQQERRRAGERALEHRPLAGAVGKLLADRDAGGGERVRAKRLRGHRASGGGTSRP